LTTGLLASGCIVTAGLHAVATPQQDFVPCPPYSCGWNTGGMSAVAAVSLSNVWAVGTEIYDSGRSIAYRAVIEHWDGQTWRVQSRPTGDYPGLSGLQGVSALAANNIWAVGQDYYGKAMVLRFDGSTWRSQRVPLPSGTYGSTLSGVVAVAPDNVWAIGSSWPITIAHKPMLVHFDGRRWSSVPLPALPAQTQLNAIAARSGVVAVIGSVLSPSPGYPIILVRANGKWKALPTAMLAPSGKLASLHGVTYAGPGALWIVGSTSNGPNGTGPQTTAAWRWQGGRWSAYAPDHRTDSYLTSVAAAGPQQVWAAGLPGVDVSGSHDGLLLTRWDGQAWTVAFSCPAPSDQSVLVSLSLSQGHVFSVGGGYKSIAVQN
jgi:hypothetical protein